MKTPIYVITVNPGGIICVNDQDESFLLLPKPFHSLFRTLWDYFSRLDDTEDVYPILEISYGIHNYRWDWSSTLTHYCFADGGLSEADFAEAIRVKSIAEGEKDE